MMNLKVKRIGDHNLPAPERASDGAAAFDLRAAEDTKLHGMVPVKVPTGFAWEIPPGHVGLLLPRSSWGVKYRFRLANTMGVIDSDYRGEILVAGHIMGTESYQILAGDRLAQLVIVQAPCLSLSEVSELSSTERGTGGFGSTGKN